MTLSQSYCNSWNGTSLSEEDTISCLKKLGHGASKGQGGIEVLVPPYRADIIHPVDLAEDVAIGHGFERFGTSLPQHATFGEEDPLNAFSKSVKGIMTGLGYFEVLTLSLSNPKEQYEAMNLPSDKSAIHVRNPVSEEHVQVRTSVLPSLMALLRKNKHRDLPQRLFEVGEVVSGTTNRRMLSGVAIHSRASFTEAKSVVQAALSALGFDSSVAPCSHLTFVPGRCATVRVADREIGVFGEVSPATIEAFGLRYPVLAFELDLDVLHELSSRR
jgi:phenylalanyl-tRNA synthetase beta chain